MSKGKNQSPKKNNQTKNNSAKTKVDEKIKNKNVTKASKTEEPKKKDTISKQKESEIKILDSIEEEEIIEEEYDEDLEEDFVESDEEEETDEKISEEDDEEDLEESEDFDDEDLEDEEETDDEVSEEDDEEIIEEEEEIEEEAEDEDFDNEDLEDIEEEEEEPIVPKEKKEKSKAKKEKQKTSKENIKKIEKLAKEKNKKAKTKNKSDKLYNSFLAIDKNRHMLYCFAGGVLITVLIVLIIWPDRIATLKDGSQPVVKVGNETYTADELYESMKSYYSVSLLLDDIDNDLLTELYPEDDEMTEEVESNAEYYLNMYEQYYGYTEEQFLQANGFSSYNAFLEYLKLDYRRSLYLDDYIEENLTDEEIQDYYDENVFGDINTQHVLVEVSSSDDDGKLSDEDAKALAEEIITKLNDGTSWETIQEEYKDKITYEDLSYQSWDASLEESFMTALKDMEDNSYSTEPVKTSYGYHVIYRIDQKEQPSLKETKEAIIENLATEKKSEDSNLLYKALISLREEKNIDFQDTVMKEKYEDYCDQYK